MSGTRKAVLIGAEVYRAAIAAPPHPLATMRAPVAEDLIRAMGWLAAGQYRTAPVAERAALERFHDPAYLDALEAAERTQEVPAEARARFGIGAEGNPVHRAVYRRPATSAGGAMLAARLTAEGGVAHVPAAGNHHAWPARASGFCYINDAVLALMEWLDLGLERLVYLDLDAHHGDGVEAAFARDGRVTTISVHEAGRWPRTGGTSDAAAGVFNFPVPEGFCDAELAFLMEARIVPAIAAARPEGIVFLPGADALADDPMSRLALSNRGLWAALEAIRGLAPRLIVLGGGGYNPYALGRAWAGLWGVLNGHAVPEALPPAALDVLAGISYFRGQSRPRPAHWLTRLDDPPQAGLVRDEVRRLAA
ncbi:acetoin utilization protein AcuC [Acidiphilium multivorum]|jgi:acetoin utilization protein AcuC|uniref:acetoin utilization protein AcuC n=1 Tax=Acidiphilium multivorum TaxID=62140 RepID=UPI0039C8E4A1